MQAVALVTGDEFLLSYNVSIDTDDIRSYIVDLHDLWDQENDAFFDDIYGIDFAFIIGPSGCCYNFNLADPDDLFHLDV